MVGSYYPWNIPSQTWQWGQICLHHPIQEPQLQIPSFYKMFCGVSPKGQQSAFNNWWTKIVHGFPRSKMEKKREICWAMPLHEKFVLQWVRTRRGGEYTSTINIQAHLNFKLKMRILTNRLISTDSDMRSFPDLKNGVWAKTHLTSHRPGRACHWGNAI